MTSLFCCFLRVASGAIRGASVEEALKETLDPFCLLILDVSLCSAVDYEAIDNFKKRNHP